MNTNYIIEGIDFDITNRTVSYNPDHENNVDTSIENNPTVDNTTIPGVRVWSIFKRKKGPKGDGNPLTYALKGERSWKFKSKKDKEAILRQFDFIATKFVQEHPIGITILVPSSNRLNNYIADTVLSKSKGAELLSRFFRKMTVQEVDDIVFDPSSKFRKVYGKNFREKYEELWDYFDEMNETRNGVFTRHSVKDEKMRDVLDFTLKLSTDRYAKFANKINDRDVLIIDDTISRGQTIREACDIIRTSYAPKSITVLTLFSKLY